MCAAQRSPAECAQGPVEAYDVTVGGPLRRRRGDLVTSRGHEARFTTVTKHWLTHLAGNALAQQKPGLSFIDLSVGFALKCAVKSCYFERKK